MKLQKIFVTLMTITLFVLVMEVFGNEVTASGPNFVNPITGSVQGVGNNHAGVDIFAPKGTAVYAAASGTIVYSEYGHVISYAGYEDVDTMNSVKIRFDTPLEYSGDTWAFQYYTHLSGLIYNVSVGDGQNIHVNAGDLIGYSGLGRGVAHLHYSFECWLDANGDNWKHMQTADVINVMGWSRGEYVTAIENSGGSDPTPSLEVDSGYNSFVPFMHKYVGDATLEVWDDANCTVRQSAYIDPGDDCIIHEVYMNGNCKVEYPTPSGNKTKYVQLSNLLLCCAESPSEFYAPKQAYAFYDAELTQPFNGWVDAGDQCLRVGLSGDGVLVIYPNASTVGRRAAWFSLGDIAYTVYTISFNANGGGGAPEKQTKTHDVDLILSTTKPIRTGYTFLGWAEDTNATNAVYQPGGKYTKNETITLYAVWQQNVVSVISVAFDTTTAIINVGDTLQLTATVSPSNATNKDVTWSTSDKKVAVVDDNGLVTGYNTGTATITVKTVDGGKTATCKVTVSYTESDITGPVKTASLNGHTYSIYNGKVAWTTAKKWCEDHGGHLMTITSAEEQALVSDMTSRGYLFIGGYRGNNTWKWVTGETFDYSNWANTQPDNSYGGTEYYLGLYMNLDWNDFRLYDEWIDGFIMEVEPSQILEGPQVIVESTSGRPGSTVAVTVKLLENQGITGARLSISYPDGFTLTGIETGVAFSDLDFTKPVTPYLNPVTLSWDGLANDYHDGTLATLTFEIPDDLEEGSYPITVTYNEGDVYDEDLENVSLRITNGVVDVLKFMYGDVNNDGAVNGKDVTLIRRYISGGFTIDVFNKQAADVNKDNTVNGKDVTLIRRYISGGFGVVLG